MENLSGREASGRGMGTNELLREVEIPRTPRQQRVKARRMLVFLNLIYWVTFPKGLV